MRNEEKSEISGPEHGGETAGRRFLLAAVNAKFIHSNPAIYSLKAYAGQELEDYVELAEYTINQPMQDILRDIYVRKPDVVGFSCYIWNRRLIGELVTELPKLLPETDIWLGGPEAACSGIELLDRYPYLTGIMTGEGEATFRELLKYYIEKWEKKQKRGRPDPENDEIQKIREKTKACREDEGLQAISGLCLRSGNTSPRPLLELTDLPFLYEDMAPFENKIIYYESGRGCPYRCSYCLSSLDKSVRLRDIAVVKRELQAFLDQGVRQVKFTDRTFNCSHDHAMEIWKYILEHDNGVTNFHFEISADLLREEEIRLLSLARPGLIQLEIGVQSTNPETLKAVRRFTDLDRLEENVAALGRGGNVHRHLDLIAGLPYEDYESFRNSFDRVYRMKPEQLQLGFLKVLKGSEMYDRAGEFGICFLEEPPYEVLYTNWLGFQDVIRLKGVEEMVEAYYNSGQFTCTLPFLEEIFSGAFAMYEALADFYKEKGYDVNHPARVRRYEILLEFAEKYDAGRLPVCRELLTCDLYLRENLKSRPKFSRELAPFQNSIRWFYGQEEKERRYLPQYKDCDRRQLGRLTHLEPFSVDVWKRLAECLALYENAFQEKPAEEVRYVLFDYSQRDPVKGHAAVRLLPTNLFSKG
ncbi:MAG: B12-binding domain-containing radical SAM protein [Acetatifactor sp.]|nr:B12-binding domain-containing radical SAM protein [Acetatifactor sp.]